MKIKLILSLLFISSTLAVASEDTQKKLSCCKKASLSLQKIGFTLYAKVFTAGRPVIAAQQNNVWALKTRWQLDMGRDTLDNHACCFGRSKDWHYHTPLQEAVCHMNPDCVKFLLEIGADPSKKTKIVQHCVSDACEFMDCKCKPEDAKIRYEHTALELAQNNVDTCEKECKKEDNDWNKKKLKKAQEVLVILTKKKE